MNYREYGCADKETIILLHGGGFLQMLLKKGVDKADVRARLKEVFQDSAVDVWDCTLV